MSERGIALGLALLALAVVGGLVSTAFLMGLQEQRVGVSTLRQYEAFAGAEAAAQRVIAQWDPDRYNVMPVGASTTTSRPGAVPGWHRLTVQRLSPRIFLVQVEGFSRDSTARQAVGQLVRLVPVPFPLRAALLVSGPLVPGGGVSGADTAPEAWLGCPKAGDTVADIATTDGTELVFDSLREQAGRLLAGGKYSVGPAFANGGCDRDVATNWGDPIRPESPCGVYFPVVWVQGDATLQAGAGQGVLLVDGDLELGGGFEFYGAVWVRGSLTMSASGGQIRGGAVVSAATLGDGGVLGAPAITFSRCALERALTMSARAQPILRGWVRIY